MYRAKQHNIKSQTQDCKGEKGVFLWNEYVILNYFLQKKYVRLGFLMPNIRVWINKCIWNGMYIIIYEGILLKGLGGKLYACLYILVYKIFGELSQRGKKWNKFKFSTVIVFTWFYFRLPLRITFSLITFFFLRYWVFVLIISKNWKKNYFYFWINF